MNFLRSFSYQLLKFLFYFFFLLLFIPFNCVCQSVSDSFKINGIINTNEGNIYITYYSALKQQGISDSSKILKGHFEFKNQLSEPAVAFISNSNDKSKFQIIFIEPKVMNIEINNEPLTIKKLSGSETNLDYDSLLAKEIIIRAKYATLLDSAHNNDGVDLGLYNSEISGLEYAFFDSHPNSVITGFLLQYHFKALSADSLIMYYDNMNNKAQNSFYGLRLNEVIKKKLQSTRKKAFNFSTHTLDNKMLRLSDFKGKYVLLDFWASWCIPCRASTPNLIKLFNRYHEKGLDIIGVADDDSRKDQWIKAIMDDHANIWYNILRGSFVDTNGIINRSASINDIFDVQELPTRILIDREGYIIARFIGTENDPKLEKKLQQIFEKIKLM